MSTCPDPPFAPPFGDYSVTGFDEATISTVCCLEYGAPYLSTGARPAATLAVPSSFTARPAVNAIH